MQFMVLIDLAGRCRKIAEDSSVPAELSVQARKFGEEFDSLLPHTAQGELGKKLLIKTAPFLAKVLASSSRIDGGYPPDAVFGNSETQVEPLHPYSVQPLARSKSVSI